MENDIWYLVACCLLISHMDAMMTSLPLQLLPPPPLHVEVRLDALVTTTGWISTALANLLAGRLLGELASEMVVQVAQSAQVRSLHSTQTGMA